MFITSEWSFNGLPEIPLIKVIGKVPIVYGYNPEREMMRDAFKVIDIAVKHNAKFLVTYDAENVYEKPEKNTYILTFSMMFKDQDEKFKFLNDISSNLPH